MRTILSASRALRSGMLAALVMLVSCAQPGREPSSAGSPSGASGEARQNPVLSMVVRYEPPPLAVRALLDAGGGISSTTRLFNAQLDIEDGDGNPRPYLAEELPRLNTDSWRVLPDGRMETSYHLRPNLSWHDGTPLTSEDFTFAWRVYSRPALGVASQVLGTVEDVTAPDSRSVVIRWKQLYPEAGGLRFEFQPLPRHLLEANLEAGEP